VSLHDHLHDRVDLREELRERATTLARQVVKDRFEEALDQTSTLEDALTLLAALVSREMDDLTTEAVRIGARYRLKRKRRGLLV